MASVTLRGVTRRFPGATRNAVDGLDLDIADGEFLVLVGPSGCGKTTTLRMLAGLDPVDSGTVRIGDDDVTDMPEKDRDIAMVFQNYALYPHMSVADNMGFGLRTRRVPKAERIRRVREAARLLDLGELLHRHPAELSGGQLQRVAMGRAIVREPKVFLMDEPLSNLDAQLRVQTRAQIASLQHRLGTTTVYVTHDQTEAMTMGDRIAVLDGGRLQQLGTPDELYERPANEFVARFIGTPAMSVWTARPVDGALPFGGASLPVPPAVAAAVGDGEVRVGIRAEDLRLAAPGEAGLPLEVRLVEVLGADAFIYGAARIAGEEVPLVTRTGGRAHPQLGETVEVVADPERLHWFAVGSGERIPRPGEAGQSRAAARSFETS